VVNGKKIRLMREAEGLTTQSFADKIVISQAYVIAIEKGYKRPAIDVLARIAEYFDLSVDDFLIKGGA